MAQPSGPDRPRDEAHSSDHARSPRRPGDRHPSSWDDESAGNGARPGRGEPSSGARPGTDPRGRGSAHPNSTHPNSAHPSGERPNSAHPDGEHPNGTASGGASPDPDAAPYPLLRAPIAGRLLLVGPLSVGVLLAEGIFAARGADANAVSLPAAVVAWLLLWVGVAYALHSWVAIVLTFVPASMMTLGAAMVGELAPGPGIALLVIGGTLLLAIIWARLVNPARRWTPGWTASPGPPGNAAGTAGIPADDAVSGLHGPPRGERSWPAASGIETSSIAREGFPGYDDVPDGAPYPPRPAPPWDTSRTDIAARDALVFALCQRGGTAGPTLATLEEFFTGNGDPRSIAPGLREALPLAYFAAVLRRLRSRSDVCEVAVQMEPLEPGEYPAGEWPAAGSIQVIGTLTADELDTAVAGLRSQAALGPLPVTELPDGRPAPDGSVEYALWWM